MESELDRLSCSIREAVCRLEMIFPPAFFDIMIHLPVHLAEEAKLGGGASVLQMDVPSGTVPTHCERICEEQGSP